jgi:hypothetical protein
MTPLPPVAATPTTVEPAEHSGLDDLLAERMAQGFLNRLAAGDAASLNLYLTDEAQLGDAGQLLSRFAGSDLRLKGATLLEFRRATTLSYEARALLHWAEVGTQTMTLTLVYQRGVWLIDRITLGDLQTTMPTPRPQASPSRSPSGLEGRLVFQVSSGGDIYLINADGSHLRRLTDGLDPAWSPVPAKGGTGGLGPNRIAFTRWRHPWGVYLINPDGSAEERVVDGTRLKEVTWSPDAERIAFTINVSSSEPIEICIFGFCFTIPPFSFGQIWVANLQSGELLSLPLDDQAVHAPTWSPSGDRIVYAGDRGIAWIDLDTMQKGRFENGSAWDTSPVFSPSEQQSRIAYMGRVHNRWEIFVMNADGSGRRQLTHSDPGLENAPSNVAPAWSPDGVRIAFLSNRDGPWRIYVMNADGSHQRPMFGDKLDSLGIRYEWATERVVSWTR